jgi:TM2 domain-containing membrane protein YozV
MALSTAELALVEARVANDGPTTGLAYVLWFFLGFFSAHRFYLGRPGTAVFQLLLNCVLVGLIWTLIDAFLIPGMVRDKKNEIRANVMTQLSGAAQLR